MKAVLIALTFLVSQVCTTDYTLYMENLAEEINKIPGITWKAEVNERFKGKTLEQIKISLGARKETEATRLPEREFTARNDLPESFDLREKYPKCEALFDIRDQGACGSCWAHSAVEVISDRICINSNQRLQYRISAEHLMSCCFSCGDGCFGGWPSSSFTWYERFGICTGGNYGDKSTCKPYSFKPCNHHGFPGPYDECEEYQSTPKCTNYCTNEQYPYSLAEDYHFGQDSYSISNNEQKIMTEIYERGSVSAVFDVYEDFPLYRGGIYRHVKGRYLGGHAVKIIGWGVEDGVKYWILVNSWNNSWGEKGYYRQIRGINDTGIEDTITACVPKEY